MNRKQFTLIELIAVIVILGIIAVVAIPKYFNMQEEAADAAAEGVLGAAQAACAMSYSENQLKGTSDFITDATSLAAKMDVDAAWSDLTETISGNTYTISVDSAETADAMATVSLTKAAATP